MTEKEDRQLSAIIATQGMSAATINNENEYVGVFTWLKPGDIFRFPSSKEILKKTGNGWYKDSLGRSFRTGANTGVLIQRKSN